MSVPAAKSVALVLVLAVLAVVLAPSTNLGKTTLRGKALANLMFDLISMALVLCVALIATLQSSLVPRREWLVPDPLGTSLLELNCVHRC